MSHRQWINDIYISLPEWETLSKVSILIQEAMLAERDGLWKDLRLNVEEDYGEKEIVIRGYRLQTVEEAAREERVAQQQKAFRKEQYEKLKKEFDPV